MVLDALVAIDVIQSQKFMFNRLMYVVLETLLSSKIYVAAIGLC